MKIQSILARLFCASTVLAAPFAELHRERRTARARRGLPRQNVTDFRGIDRGINVDRGLKTEYSKYWAGATLIGSGYTSVTGTIVMPTPQTPPGGDSSTQYSAAVWVGIDGYTCGTALIQTGIAIWIQNGQPWYNAWYEWFPEASENFENFNINAGDTIEMNVEASSQTSGTVTINNLSTGQSASHHFTDRKERLCQTNAEWVVEDFTSDNNELVPFVDFTTVTFERASAVSHGSTVDTTGATILDIKQNKQILTSCSADGSKVVCSYV